MGFLDFWKTDWGVQTCELIYIYISKVITHCSGPMLVRTSIGVIPIIKTISVIILWSPRHAPPCCDTKPNQERLKKHVIFIFSFTFYPILVYIRNIKYMIMLYRHCLLFDSYFWISVFGAVFRISRVIKPPEVKRDDFQPDQAFGGRRNRVLRDKYTRRVQELRCLNVECCPRAWVQKSQFKFARDLGCKV